jgi:hypothetical protein
MMTTPSIAVLITSIFLLILLKRTVSLFEFYESSIGSQPEIPITIDINATSQQEKYSYFMDKTGGHPALGQG